MRARDILKDFLIETFSAPADADVKEGIFSDIYGTLLKKAPQEGGLMFSQPAPYVIDQPYYDFLLWAHGQGIPVTLVSSEVGRAKRDLTTAGCAPELLATLSDKISVYMGSDKPFEVIIDDSLILEPSVIFINPTLPKFRQFVATCQYKNPGISRPADLPRPPGP